MRRGDHNNGIKHKGTQHEIDWEGARVKSTTPNYWQRRIIEAIRIKTSGGVMNLDSVEPCTYYTQYEFVIPYICLFTYEGDACLRPTSQIYYRVV